MTQHLLYKNIKIFYEVTGLGTPIVLLHGFLENSSMWKYLVPALAQKYQVICIDLLGHGKTECLGYVSTMLDMAEAVNVVLVYLKIEKTVVVGHSMGGYVALAFAKIQETKILGLVLLNSSAYADSEERKSNRKRAIKAVKQNYIAAVRMSIGNLFSEENREKFEDEIEWIRNEALTTPLQGIIAAQEGMIVRENHENILQNAHYPILLILGKKDPVLNYNETKKQVENTSVKLISFNDGHMSYIENQVELELVLIEFLAEF